MRYTLAIVLCALAPAPLLAQPDWPKFRGPAGSGVAEGDGYADTWSTTKGVLWKADVPGNGWSSPIVVGDRVFVTSFVVPGKPGAPKIGFYLQPGTIPEGECRWVVHCFDFRTGKPLWEKDAFRGKPTWAIHPKNSYAAQTPSSDGKRVFAFFGNVGLFCYDLDGKELWNWKCEPTRTRSDWGPGASPVLHKGRLYVVNDNEDRSYLAALDAVTGKEVWKVTRDEKTSWATPFVWETADRTEIVTCATGKVRSCDTDGKLLWELGPMSDICIPTPVAGENLLYVSSGYEFGNKTRPIYAVRPGAKGDISLKPGETGNEFVAWTQPSAGSYNPSPLLYSGRLYVLYSQGFLSCFDAKTGKEIYARERLGGTFSASPWAADGKVFCLSETGDTSVIAAGDEFKLLGKNRLNEVALATPATVRHALVVRTQSKLYRIERGAGEPKQ